MPACGDAREKLSEHPFMDIAPSDLAQFFGAEADSRSVTVLTNQSAITATSDRVWCSVVAAKGGLNSASAIELTVSVTGNDGIDTRNAFVAVSAGVLPDITIAVTQEGNTPSLSVTPENIAISGDDRRFSVDVAGNVPFTVTLPEWVENDGNNTPVTGSKTYHFIASSPMPGVTREGNIVIASTAGGAVLLSKTVKVTQTAEAGTKTPTGRIYRTTDASSSYTFDRADYTVFIPEDVGVIRGVLVHQHGCTMEGLGASTAYDVQYQSFAKKWKLAVVAPDLYAAVGNCDKWRNVESGSAQALFDMLNEVGALSGHPEIADAPLLLWGHSGGGYWTLSMLKTYPERIMAIFAYSPAFDPTWNYPETALKIPLMIRHAGDGDANDPPVSCHNTALHAFDRLRPHGGLVSLAYTPGQTHNFSYVRYMAIPFFEAALAQRLPQDGAAGYQAMRDMDAAKAWLGDPDTKEIYKASACTGDKTALHWLPDQNTAAKWKEYISTGTVTDVTPPEAPYDVKIERKNQTTVTLTWKADADIESGISHFNIRKNNQLIGRFPSSGKYQQFSTNGDDAIPAPAPELRMAISLQTTEQAQLSITAVNHFELESEKTTILVGKSD
ncbi:MAG: hypothetical protein LBR08_05710 [Bacteroidales bacterium]|nr:hypothetical protein [Bacteroidales bacterium]